MLPTFDNIKIIDDEGYWSDSWRSIMQQLFETLQSKMNAEGLVVPSQSAANIALLTNSPNGTLVYDYDNNLLKIRINSAWKTITTS